MSEIWMPIPLSEFKESSPQMWQMWEIPPKMWKIPKMWQIEARCGKCGDWNDGIALRRISHISHISHICGKFADTKSSGNVVNNMWQLGKDVANVGDSKSPHMWQLDKKSPHMWQMLWQMWEIFLDQKDVANV